MAQSFSFQFLQFTSELYGGFIHKAGVMTKIVCLPNFIQKENVHQLVDILGVEMQMSVLADYLLSLV